MARGHPVAGEDHLSFSLRCVDPLQTCRGLCFQLLISKLISDWTGIDEGLGNGGDPLAGKCVLGTDLNELIFRSNN